MMTYFAVLICITLVVGQVRSQVTSPSPGPTVTAQTAYAEPSMPWNWRHTAFITCGLDVFPNETMPLETIFPPSDFSKHLITKTGADSFKSAQRLALAKFCSNVSVYSSCVKEKLVSGAVEVDFKLGLVIDGNSFPAAMKKYCDNKDEVISQFDCTFSGVRQHPCTGGILDILHAFVREVMVRGFLLGYSCSEIVKQKTCRIEKQLSGCNATYVSLMAEIANMLLKAECRKGGTVYDNSKTDSMPCFREYLQNISERTSTYPNSRHPTHDQIAYIISSEYNVFCGHTPNMVNCLKARREPSKKPMDVFSKRFMSIGNFENILAFGCSRNNLFTQNGECAVRETTALISNQSSCFPKVSEQMSTVLQALGGNEIALFENKTLISQFCKGLKQYADCMKPPLQACNAKLGEAWQTLAMYVYNSCSNPNYVVPSQQNSTGTSLLASFATVLLAFVLALK